MEETVKQLREKLGKASVLADPSNYEEVVKLREEVRVLRKNEDEFQDIVNKIQREKDLAKSSLEAAEARHKAERIEREIKLNNLKNQVEIEELNAAICKAAEIESQRLVHVSKKLLRDAQMKALLLECQLEIIEREQTANRVDSEASGIPQEVSTVPANQKLATEPKDSRVTGIQEEEKQRKPLLSPAYDGRRQTTKVLDTLTPARRTASKIVKQDTSSSKRRQDRQALNEKKQRKANREEVIERSEDESSVSSDSDTTPAKRKPRKSNSSTGSKNKAKPRYSVKSKSAQDAFTAFDLTRRMAAPKLKGN